MFQKKSLVELKESLKEEGFSSIGGMTMCFLELHVFTESVTVKCSKLTNVRCLEITCLLFDFSKQLNTEEELLEFEATQFPILQAMIAYKEPYDKLWRTTLSFHNKNEAWLNGNNVFFFYLMATLYDNHQIEKCKQFPALLAYACTSWSHRLLWVSSFALIGCFITPGLVVEHEQR